MCLQLLSSLDPLELAGVVVAGCALVATIWQGALTRKHNRLSVRPVLTLYREEQNGKIYIKNNGTGPALIREYKVYGESEVVVEQSWRTALPLVFDAAFPSVDTALAPGDTIDLIASKTYIDGSHIPQLRALRFRIRYASIYGEAWTLE